MITISEISPKSRRNETVIQFEGHQNSFWSGRADSVLNLAGHVNPRTLHNVFEGKSPNGKTVQNEILHREALRREGEFSHAPFGWKLDCRAPSDLSKLALHASYRTERILKDLWEKSVKTALLEFDRNLSGSPLFAVKHFEPDIATGRGLQSLAVLINSRFHESGHVSTFAPREVEMAGKTSELIQNRVLAQSLSNEFGLIVSNSRDGLSIQGVSALQKGEAGKLSKILFSALTLSPADSLIRSHQELRSKASSLSEKKEERSPTPESKHYWSNREVRQQIRESMESDKGRSKNSSSDGKSLGR